MKSQIGLGFRRDLSDEIIEGELTPDFIEVAPENWIGIGGYWKRKFDKAAERYPILSHGLSLSIGSSESLDLEHLKNIKVFLSQYDIQIYSEHLSYTKSDNAHLYDLLPIPFREDAVRHISDRIGQVQDFLGRSIAMENVSYYTPIASEMSEVEFISEIVKRSGCDLLLDVNNVYVNSFNHKYDPRDFIEKLPLNHVVYIHMAGHEKVSEDTIIDTHGQPIIDEVYKLFDWTLNHLSKPIPVLLERDFNFDDLSDLQAELSELKRICKKHWDGFKKDVA